MRERLDLIWQIGCGLDYLHGYGYLHLDLKPSNVLVREDGTPVLADFGLATVLGSERHGGTWAYMAPELLATSRPELGAGFASQVSVRTDLYSLGILAYEACVGERPHARQDPLDELTVRLQCDPPALPLTVPYELRLIVRRLIDRDPAARPESAAVVCAALRPGAGYPDLDTLRRRLRRPALAAFHGPLENILADLSRPAERGIFEVTVVKGQAESGKTRFLEELYARARPEWRGSILYVRNTDEPAAAFQRWDKAMPAGQRLLVLVDDAERLSRKEVLVLETWRDWCAEARLVVCARGKPMLPSYAARAYELTPLAKDDVEVLLRETFQRILGSQRAAAVLHRACGGSPGLLVALLDALAAHGAIRKNPLLDWEIDLEALDLSALSLRDRCAEARGTLSGLDAPASRLLWMVAAAEDLLDEAGVLAVSGLKEKELAGAVTGAGEHVRLEPDGFRLKNQVIGAVLRTGGERPPDLLPLAMEIARCDVVRGFRFCLRYPFADRRRALGCIIGRIVATSDFVEYTCRDVRDAVSTAEEEELWEDAHCRAKGLLARARSLIIANRDDGSCLDDGRAALKLAEDAGDAGLVCEARLVLACLSGAASTESARLVAEAAAAVTAADENRMLLLKTMAIFADERWTHRKDALAGLIEYALGVDFDRSVSLFSARKLIELVYSHPHKISLYEETRRLCDAVRASRLYTNPSVRIAVGLLDADTLSYLENRQADAVLAYSAAVDLARRNGDIHLWHPAAAAAAGAAMVSGDARTACRYVEELIAVLPVSLPLTTAMEVHRLCGAYGKAVAYGQRAEELLSAERGSAQHDWFLLTKADLLRDLGMPSRDLVEPMLGSPHVVLQRCAMIAMMLGALQDGALEVAERHAEEALRLSVGWGDEAFFNSALAAARVFAEKFQRLAASCDRDRAAALLEKLDAAPLLWQPAKNLLCGRLGLSAGAIDLALQQTARTGLRGIELEIRHFLWVERGLEAEAEGFAALLRETAAGLPEAYRDSLYAKWEKVT
ncbi:MAG: serine/threonine protein kinase [Candidatus Schekmanbacteria bacterium]|nr:serine/threonine protein kinase [Candidatus Schekmanbacteria bacterium]